MKGLVKCSEIGSVNSADGASEGEQAKMACAKTGLSYNTGVTVQKYKYHRFWFTRQPI